MQYNRAQSAGWCEMELSVSHNSYTEGYESIRSRIRFDENGVANKIFAGRTMCLRDSETFGVALALLKT